MCGVSWRVCVCDGGRAWPRILGAAIITAHLRQIRHFWLLRNVNMASIVGSFDVVIFIIPSFIVLATHVGFVELAPKIIIDGFVCVYTHCD